MSLSRYFPPRVTEDTWPLLLTWDDIESRDDVTVTPGQDPDRFSTIPWWSGDHYYLDFAWDARTGSTEFLRRIRLFFPVSHNVSLTVSATVAGDNVRYCNPEVRLLGGSILNFPFDPGSELLATPTLPATGGPPYDESESASGEFGPGLFVVEMFTSVGEHPDDPAQTARLEIEWSPA